MSGRTYALNDKSDRATGNSFLLTVAIACCVFATGMIATHWTAVRSTLKSIPTISQLSKTMRNFTYYRDCAAARAAGAAPIMRGQPGYRRALDADNDGIACEPYVEW